MSLLAFSAARPNFWAAMANNRSWQPSWTRSQVRMVGDHGFGGNGEESFGTGTLPCQKARVECWILGSGRSLDDWALSTHDPHSLSLTTLRAVPPLRARWFCNCAELRVHAESSAGSVAGARSGSWWSKLLRASQSERALIVECLHDEPIELPGLLPGQLLSLASSIYAARGIPWTAATRRVREPHALLDPLHRPLFGMMAAAYAGSAATDSVADVTLLREVLRKETARRREAVPDDDRLRKLENLLVLATLAGGLLPRSGGFSFLAATDIAALIPDPDLLDAQLYLELAAASGIERSLPGLQPGVLGERFVLDRVADRGSLSGSFGRLLVAAWSLQANDLCAISLSARPPTFQRMPLDILCDLPLGAAWIARSLGRTRCRPSARCEEERYWAERKIADKAEGTGGFTPTGCRTSTRVRPCGVVFGEHSVVHGGQLRRRIRAVRSRYQTCG